MMARRGVLGALAGGMAALGGLGGCAGRDEARYRFRLTVAIETPAGLQSGASVYEVMARGKAALAPGGKAREWSAVGQAVAVDLPGRQTLFALLRTGAIHHDLAGLSMAALDPAFRNDMIESAARIAARDGIRSPADVRAADYPWLVRLGDPADPASAALVDPADLAAAFGPGVRLAGIRAELADAPVTSGLADRLPWLAGGSLRGPPGTGPRLRANADPYDHSPIATLAHGDFIRKE